MPGAGNELINASVVMGTKMILMYSEQIEKLRVGELKRFKVGKARNWRPGTIHMVKTYQYGKAKAYARVVAIRDAGDSYELELERATAFDYLRQERPDFMQLRIDN